jgi:hypothetical protein
MKKLMSLVALSLVITANSVYASFPVNNKKANTTEVVVNQDSEKQVAIDDAKLLENSKLDKKEIKRIAKNANKSADTELIITLLLWLFLGGLAAHRWYAGKPVGWNILFILTAGGCGVWAIIDLINILRGNW